jgi:hypothetical protein
LFRNGETGRDENRGSRYNAASARAQGRRTDSRHEREGNRVAQINPDPAYDHRLAERVVVYLQTRDSALFPFTARFDEERRRAFIRDLQEGLADLQDSGSARKTSAAGFIMNDRRLQEVVAEWAAADGDWPRGLGTGLGPIRSRERAGRVRRRGPLSPG